MLFRLLKSISLFIKYLLQYRRYAISPGDKVLDIGGGNSPLARANVVVEKFLFQSGERANGHAFLNFGQTIVCADAQYLPFKNHAFDFVLATHIAEHVDDPGLFIREMERVGKRGYIECPSALLETLYGWNFHKWAVKVRDGKLCFLPKLRADGLLPAHIKKSREFETLRDTYFDDFFAALHWEGSIAYSVEGKPFIAPPSAMDETTEQPFTIATRLRLWLIGQFRKQFLKLR